MGKWREDGPLEPFRRRLLAGMARRGYSEDFARQLYDAIRGFGEYGFPESHAASFALLTYVSAWLKHHHPAAFCCALLNSQPMGFYAPAQLVRDARAHGVEVRPVDINASAGDSTLEVAAAGRPALRLGLRLVRGLSEARLRAIAAARAKGPFASVANLVRRTGLPHDALAQLAAAGALAAFGLGPREALWAVLACAREREEHPLFADQDAPSALADLPALGLLERAELDYAVTGLSLGPHPLELLRPTLRAAGALEARRMNALPQGHHAAVAGLVICRQRPATASGVVFYALEDETGTANLIVRPQVFARFRAAARGAGLLLARGRIEREGQVVHLLVRELEEVSRRGLPLRCGSR